MRNLVKLIAAMALAVFSVSATAVPMNIIDGDACAIVDVNATGYGDSDLCKGLLDNSGSGNFNDSEDLLNSILRYGDNDGGVIWDADGAFGHNDWVFLGKDERETDVSDPLYPYDFINATSGDPAGTWSVDSALSGTYLIAIKQAGELGFWYFDALDGVTMGELYFDSIFGYGFTDDGWSHVSIYGTASSVPEPTMVGLLAIGLLGMVAARRRMKV